MTLSSSYIQSQRFRLGEHANKTLNEIGDNELTARTLIYSNLCEVGRKNLNFKSGVIAQLVADILDARAWEDYVEVDGTRKSCESFSTWLEQNGVDLELAEFAIKEKKADYLAKFYEARDGKIEGNGGARWSGLNNQQRAEISKTNPERSKRSCPYFLRRLNRDAELGDQKAVTLLGQLNAKQITITAAAIEMGYKQSRVRADCAVAIKSAGVQIVNYSKHCSIKPEELIKRALEEFVENHPDPQNL